MHIDCLTVGRMYTNCYILAKDRDAKDILVVDPGAEAETIQKAVGDRHVAAVLLTHGHFDHTGALYAFQGKPIYIHEKDAAMLQDKTLSAAYVVREPYEPRPEATHLIKEGDVLKLAGLELTVLNTPGHTAGSVCFQVGSDLLTGDTLFGGGYGRTDLPTGSIDDMRLSLRRLLKEYKGSHLYPGHGEDSILK